MSKSLGAYGPPTTRPSKGYDYDDRYSYGYSDYSSKPKGFSTKGERPEGRRPPPDSGTDFVSWTAFPVRKTAVKNLLHFI